MATLSKSQDFASSKCVFLKKWEGDQGSTTSAPIEGRKENRNRVNKTECKQ